MGLREHLLDLEQQLLSAEVRQNASLLQNFLSPDFREFGSSGRIFDFTGIAEALAGAAPPAISIEDFDIQNVSGPTVLATYRAVPFSVKAGESLRSSLWTERGGRWRMLFHQGTKVPSKAALIETERLILRPHLPSDFPAMCALWADVEVTRYIGGRPFSEEETWSRYLRYTGHWQQLGFGMWAIESKATAAFLGEIGYAHLHRAIDHEVVNQPEIGWALAVEAQGQGVGTEAAEAVTAWGDAYFHGQRTFCLIHPDNARSLRLAGKLGYREDCRTTYHGLPAVVLIRG